MLEHLHWKASAMVEKWHPDSVEWARRHSGIVSPSGSQLSRSLGPDETVEWEGNLLVNVGIQRLEDLLIGVGSIAAYTNTTARLGTGNGVTAATATDTDLSAAAGASNRWFNAMDATFPSRSAQTLTFKATFASGDGNYAWNEWGIDGGGAASAVVGTAGASTAPLLNHKSGAALGTKVAGAIWSFSSTVILS